MISNKKDVPMRYYILIGDEKTWEIALQNLQWGFKKKNKGTWESTKKGELVAFYVTTPIQKIIGFGKISEKFTSKDLLWPDEKLFKIPIWENRVKFEIDSLVKNWNNGIKPPSGIMLNVGRKVINEEIFNSMLKESKKKWNTKTEQSLRI
jgi:hypothetical protein